MSTMGTMERANFRPSTAASRPAASRLAASAIVAATMLVYLNAFGNAFLWDDRFLVVDNPAIKHWGNIARIFTHALFPEGIRSRYYRPLQTLTYLVDYQPRPLR